MNATLTTHRPFSGPFKWVGIKARQAHDSYGLVVFEDGEIQYEHNNRQVDYLPDDGLSDCLIAAYFDHRDDIAAYLKDPSGELWHLLTMSVEGFTRIQRTALA